MKYTDSLEKSAEYLRQAVQFMVRQAAALHPVSYAVWYEYASGQNAFLNNDIDTLTADGAVLDEKATYDLFRKHIAGINEATTERVTNGFQRIMTNISNSASQAQNEAEKFGSALEHWTGKPAASRVSGLDDLLGHTRIMQGSISTLKLQLEESKHEIEQLRSEVKKAREEALSDGLTGLINRKGFDLAVAACLERHTDDTVGPSLFITDIDNFKRVNDTYGHLLGDKVIRAIAKILSDNIKNKDIAARFGGEEFIVLLPDTPLDGARQLAEKIRVAIQKLSIKRADKNEAVTNITVSLGVTSYRKGEPVSEFIARADNALYQSKNGGRNRVTAAED